MPFLVQTLSEALCDQRRRNRLVTEIRKKKPNAADFKTLVLEAQKESDQKLGHYEYLQLEKRSFPGSFVSQLQLIPALPPTQS